ncbi:CaiB/BaiF CoA transferase family protein [Enemella sp. A6]|uniref:CaiB/BaiF CoA transferase family protein n=1 Tax=Enemella sp. A6 TaxID=3440152 RepID=UPI003EB7886E
MSTGPLRGVRVVELATIGPVPHAAMLLADLGADVVRIQRPGMLPKGTPDAELRGRRVVEADLRSDAGREVALSLLDKADVVLEGFRPGVTERLGLGPDDLLPRNPGLVYGRMTGWGQHGPRAQQAGHDLNYISRTGLLHAVGRPDEVPVPPLNLFGDFGGGSMYLVVGVLAALLERGTSGQGQVIDAAMVDGALSLSTIVWAFRGMGVWNDERGSNYVDSGAHFYEVYRTADDKFLAVGAIEPQFYAMLLEGLGFDADEVPNQHDRSTWPAMKERFAERIATRTRAEWEEIFDGTDACVTGVLTFAEAAEDTHIAARGSLVEVDGVVQPAPAPRFSRTEATMPTPPATEACDPATIWA